MSAGDNLITVSGIDIQWNVENGECAFEKLPVAMMWVDTTLAGLFSGVQSMVGTRRYLLALQSEGRKSVDDDWNVISKHTDFRDGFKAIANIAAVAGWGQWELVSIDAEKMEAIFRASNSWEGAYQKSLGVCWGSGFLAGKLAGYCSKLFKTNCWAEQISYVAKGDMYDEFLVKPSNRSIELEMKNLLASDESTRADMAVALRALEKENAERRLSEEKYRLLFENNRDAVMILEPPEWKFTSCNQATVIMFNTGDEGSFTKMAPWELSPELQPDGQISEEKAKAMIDLAMRNGTHFFEWTHKRKEGDNFPATVLLSKIDIGEKTILLATVRDITDLYISELTKKKLIEQEKHAIVGKVAGSIAHDFNNILGIILGSSDILLLRDLPDEIKTKIKRIQNCSLRGRELTKNLLRFARSREPNKELFDVNQMIRTLVQSLEAELENIDVVTDFEADMNSLRADVGMLENALINMFKNSIHAMSKTQKPMLTLRTFAEEANLCIEIDDNGCGIPVEAQHKIYDPTFTLKGKEDKYNAYRPDIKGSGYGLWNVKHFVLSHGGTIELIGKADSGAKFRITLPGSNRQSQFESAEIDHIHSEYKNKRVLLIEDDQEIAEILYSILIQAGCEVDVAENAKTALSLFESKAYDVISLDYLLPDENGIFVYRKIRETNKDIPVIFVSGNFEFMQSMIDLKGSDPNVDHISKPFKNIVYENKIHEWLYIANQTEILRK